MRTNSRWMSGIVLYIAASVAVPAGAGTARGNELTALARQAVEHSYELKSAGARISQGRYSLEAAQRQRYPSLNFQASLVRSDDPVFVFGSLLRQDNFTQDNFAIETLNRPGPVDNFSSSVELSVPLFAAYRITNGVRAADTGLAQARAAADLERRTLLSRVTAAYLDALYFTALVREAESAEGFARKELEAQQRLAASGMATGAEYHGARAQLYAISARKAGWESRRRAVLERLNIIAGNTDASGILSGNLRAGEFAVPAMETLTAEALRRRGDLAVAALEADSLKTAYDTERRSALPAVSAFGALQGDTGDFNTMPVKYTAGVKLSVPVADPAHGARVKGAAGRYEEGRLTLEARREAVRAEVAEAYNGFSGAQAVHESAGEGALAAERAAALTRSLFRQGRQNVADTVRAESSLLDARAAALEAAWQLNRSYAALLAAAGEFDEAAVDAIGAVTEGSR